MAAHALDGLTVNELKARLRSRGCTDFSQFLERGDLLQALGAGPPSSGARAPLAGCSGAGPSVGSTWAGSGGGPGEEDAEHEVEVGPGCSLRVAERRSAFDNGNTGAVLWDSSVRLARHVFGLGRSRVAGKRVVELGCGTGLAGLAAGMQGAHVTLTDLPEVLSQTTQANLEANHAALRAPPAGAPAGEVELQPLRWGDGVDHLQPGPPFDFVLAADIIYRPELFEPLRKTLLQLSGPGTHVLLAYTRRRSQEEWFFSSVCEDFSCSVISGGDGSSSEAGWRGFCRFGESAIFLLVRKPHGSSL